jgi:hypothetical protein
MSWTWLTNLTKTVLGSSKTGEVIGNLVDKLPDANEKLQLQLTLQQLIASLQMKILGLEEQLLASKTDLIKAEMQGNWMQRSWRPVLMLMFGFIICYNYWFAPTFSTPMTELPDDFWQLLKISVGGYVIGRSGEKIVPELANKLKKK